MKKVTYTNDPSDIAAAIKASVPVKDFLPSPDQLVFKEDNVKVTLELSKNSIRLFKNFAHKRGYKYQRMIRNLVDQYANQVLN
jgi:predicted DNA binding CopG/RHH family protein